MIPRHWREIPEWPEYEVSELGDVRRIQGGQGAQVGLILKPWGNPKSGYLCVTLWRGNKRLQQTVHRLVALAFLGQPPSPKHLVAHADGSRTNNARDNLRWATQKQNMADRVQHGTVNWGGRNGQAKLDEVCVLAIRKMQNQSIPRTLIADGYGISRRTVDDILNRRRWDHLSRAAKLELEAVR